MLWVLAGVGIVTVFVFSHVDDWSRDFTTNVASTDEKSRTLRPLMLEMPPDQVLHHLREVVESLPRWQEVALRDESPQATGTLHVQLVRTTPLMRFKDDIDVRLVASDDGRSTTVHVHSQSRIGRGDLGQNPRNIRELLDRLAGMCQSDH